MFLIQQIINQREEVLASRKRRSEQLEKLLADAQERLNDHNNGIKLVTDEEKQKLEKKIEVFSKKLESMSKEPDEREIHRIIQREKLIKERHFERRKLREEL